MKPLWGTCIKTVALTGHLNTKDLTVAIGVDSDGDQRVDPDDPAVLTHLEHQRPVSRAKGKRRKSLAQQSTAHWFNPSIAHQVRFLPGALSDQT